MEAFAAYYFDALDWSYATNDPYLIEKVAAPTCTACRRAADRISALSGEGRLVTGGRLSVRRIDMVFETFGIKADRVLEVTTFQSAVQVSAGVGQPASSVPAQTSRHLFFASWRGGRWQVDEIGARK